MPSTRLSLETRGENPIARHSTLKLPLYKLRQKDHFIHDNRHLLCDAGRLCFRVETTKPTLYRPFLDHSRPCVDTRYPVVKCTPTGSGSRSGPLYLGDLNRFTCINDTDNDSNSLPGNNGSSATPAMPVTMNVSLYKCGPFLIPPSTSIAFFLFPWC